jgi:hypothetical protein
VGTVVSGYLAVCIHPFSGRGTFGAYVPVGMLRFLNTIQLYNPGVLWVGTEDLCDRLSGAFFTMKEFK